MKRNQNFDHNRSQKVLSCRYNMDTNRVEVRFEDGATLSIDCIRMGLIHELRLMKCYLMPDETALRELSEQVIEKLKLLTDAEFAELEFPLD